MGYSTLDICTRHVNVQADARLLSLPLEILHSIANRSDAVGRICLTLTCKKATNAIGVAAWEGVRVAKRNPKKTLLLCTLSRDLPQYHYCYYQDQLCLAPEAGGQALDERGTKECQARSLKAGEHLALNVEHVPSFCDIQLTMIRHNKGAPFGTPVEALAFNTPWRIQKRHRHLQGNFYTYFVNQQLEPAIADHRLFTHYTSRFWISTRDFNDLRERVVWNSHYHALLMRPCPHVALGFLRGLLINLIEDVAKSAVSSGSTEPIVKKPTMCSVCPAEHRMLAFNHGDNGVEFVHEVWMDLGDGIDECISGHETRINRNSTGETSGFLVCCDHLKSLSPSGAMGGAGEPVSAVDSEALAVAVRAWKRFGNVDKWASSAADRPVQAKDVTIQKIEKGADSAHHPTKTPQSLRHGILTRLFSRFSAVRFRR